MSGRDDFKASVKEALARRVAFRCSNPDCRRATVGPQAVAAGDASIGVAAHITAAAPGGPRYDVEMTATQRAGPGNGIWLCQNCSRRIDVDPTGYTVELLQTWKNQSEDMALREFATGRLVIPRALLPMAEDEHGNPLVQLIVNGGPFDPETLIPRLSAAAQADLEGFKRAFAVPFHTVGLTLTFEGSGGKLALTAAEVARSSQLANGLCVVAAPGAGKTVTLLQIAESVLTTGEDVALFVPMSEWAAANMGLLEAVSTRASFEGLGTDALRAAAMAGRLVLILDAWNELDSAARTRAVHALSQLRRELPLLRIVASTRRQALDVPGLDAIVSLQGLSSQQQQALARELRGAVGERQLERARRTPGLRELMAIPLYLRALLAVPPEEAETTTKEAVLSRMVEHHERIAEQAQALLAELHGCHRDFLVGLAVMANAAGRTALTEVEARAAIARVQQTLVANGQLAVALPPMAVLDSLVAHHVLVRIGGPERVLAFQHQQLQEWFASFEVERILLTAAAGRVEDRQRLRREIVDRRPWEESILFACERVVNRGEGRAAVVFAVSEALVVDPMLAALIVSRVGDAVWDDIGEDFLNFGRRWHRPDEVDRAVRFMVISGRPEFAALIWPLISNPDMQVHLSTLRAAPRFSLRVLGTDAEPRLAALPDVVREHVLSEIASHGDLEGMELAASLAKADPNSRVQRSVAEFLLFRGAERLALDVLEEAPDALWQEMARHRARSFEDEDARARMARAEREVIAQERDPSTRLWRMLHAEYSAPEIAREVESLFAGDEWPVRGEYASRLAVECLALVPDTVLAALQRHLFSCGNIPAGAGELLHRLPDIDEGPIAALAVDPDRDDQQASDAASIVGSRTVRALLRHQIDLRIARDGAWDRQSGDRFLRLGSRVERSRRHAFVAAWLDEAHGQTDPRAIEVLAEALARHGRPDHEGEPFLVEEPLMARLVEALREMSSRLLDSSATTRGQMADAAAAVGRLAKPELLPLLLALLQEDLRRWRAARAARARRDPGDHSDAAWDWTNWYARALTAIGGNEVIEALRTYLDDLEFGEAAAGALCAIDARRRGVSMKADAFFVHKFAHVVENRAARQRGDVQDSPLSTIVFDAIERLLDGEPSADAQRHALKLAAIAMEMPYRDRSGVIARLLAASLPIRARRGFVVALVRAGETLEADCVLDGLRSCLESAVNSPWMLQHGQTWELDEWLALLAFTNRPQSVLEGFDLLPAEHRNWRLRRGMLEALRYAPDLEAEQALADIARRTPEVIAQGDLLRALLERHTPSAILTLLDIVRDAPAIEGDREIDRWWATQTVSSIVGHSAELRRELLRRYDAPAHAREHDLIERLLAAVPDRQALLAIVERYGQTRRAFDSILGRAVEEMAQERRADPEWSPGVYEIAAIPATELRRDLLRKVGEGGAAGTVAAGCLRYLDEWHDRHGVNQAEPRHPDVASGIRWPILPV